MVIYDMQGSRQPKIEKKIGKLLSILNYAMQ